MSDGFKPAWHRSTQCQGGNCIEVAHAAGGRLVRDGKAPDGPWLRFSHDGWAAFVTATRAGHFDRIS